MYTIKQAKPVLLEYLGLTEKSANYLPNTDEWGIVYEKNNLKCVIFIMPLGENTSSPKIYFDVRDSGAEKFVAAWNYAEENNLKFFCLGVKDENEKFKNYVVSIEADVNTVLKISGLENGRRSGSGTQLNIPSDLVPIGNIVRKKSNKFDIFFSAIEKNYLLKYLEIFDNRLFQFIKTDKEDKKIDDTFQFVFSPIQTIYYGVPGCGKSNKIDEETINTSDEQKMRVVFHPEYTNADFVGQILPTNVDGNVEYKFRPGPLSKILRRAYLHPDKKYYLIVEEINRGNAAAIFGEYFQLLDRIAAKKEVPANGYTYTEGWSSYSIENEFINWYIRENLYADVNHKLQNEDDGIAKKSDDESQKAIEIGNLHFSANTGIRLPPNLSILATMNTSDQNVFILDNAFQRRWDMVLVKNEFGKAKTEEEQKNVDQQKTALIGDSQITWETFQKTINEKISQFSKENNFSSMIDKRLGCWFVKAVPDKNDANGKYIITEDSFKNKILKYLWDDAFKFCHEDVFEDADNFEALLEKVKMDNPDFGVFKNVDFSAEKSEKSESQHKI